MLGEVHDENAFALGGVAAHAGLFGTADDVASLGQVWLDVLQGRSDFLPRDLAQEAVQLQAEDGDVRRGLGWALWSPLPESASHPLSRSSFGHTGFTGTSLYIDPERELVIACLTNEVYNGRIDRGIGAFRVRLHKEIRDWRSETDKVSSP
jgi:CubicO group peptidase (beta-lactamase class C family)